MYVRDNLITGRSRKEYYDTESAEGFLWTKVALPLLCVAAILRVIQPRRSAQLFDSKLPGEPSTQGRWRGFVHSDRRVERELRMKVLRAATLMALLLAGPAYAQQKPPPPTDPPKSLSDIEREKSTDQAYKK